MPPSPHRNLLVTAIVALIAGAAVGTAIGAQEAGVFSEQIEIRRVEIEVVVTDAAGHRVRGLPKDLFELSVDGKPVEIREFAERSAESPTSEAGVGADAPGEPPEAEPKRLGGSRPGPSARPQPVTWAIYVDSGSIPPGPRNDALRQLETFLARSASPADRFLVVSFDGRDLRFLTPLLDFASGRGALAVATHELSKLTGEGASRRASAQQLLLLLNQVVSSGGAGQPGDPGRRGAPGLLQSFLIELERYIAEEERLSKLSLRALEELIRILSGVADQRVAVVQVGGALPLRPGEAMWERARGRLETQPGGMTALAMIRGRIANLAPEVSETFRRANTGRLTFYTIDAGTGDAFGLTPAEETGLPGLTEGTKLETAGAALPLSALAAATGGRGFRATPKLGERLREAAADLESHYALAYEPAAGASGRHQIQVRLLRPGLEVRHREAVTELDPTERGQVAALQELLSPGHVDDLGARAEVAAAVFGASGASSRSFPVKVRIPLARLGLTPDGEIHRGRIALHFAVADGHREYRRLESKAFDFQVPQARLESARGEEIIYTFELPRAYLGWRLGLVVLDAVSGARTTLQIPLSPAPPLPASTHP